MTALVLGSFSAVLRRSALLVTTVVFSATGTAWFVTSGDAARTSPKREIAFVRGIDRPGIWVVDVASTRQRRLTRNRLGDDNPEWSPHGSRIAFVRDAYGMGEIYVMNANGTKKRRLTRNRAFDAGPVWSPDGRRIAFRSDRDGQTAIYTMNSDGEDQTKLTRSTTPQGGLTWSPDGSRIAFVAFKQALGTGGPTEIRVVDVDGTDERRLTRAGTQDTEPAWSPDGRQIVFTRGFLRFSRSDQRYEHTRSEIWRVNADGRNARRLTRTRREIEDFFPAWSPDGRRIAFASDRSGNRDIYVMDRNGRALRRLTRGPGEDRWPAWAPHGHRIAFISDRSGNDEIFVMKANGSDQRRLTRSPRADDQPVWRPVR
jgi:Tol biopolymer transport system component